LGIPTTRVNRQALDSLNDNHQGVALEASGYPYSTLPEILDRARERQEAPFILALDLLQNPQNLGTLMRTAEAVGVHGAIVPERQAAGVTPAVSRASAGAVEHLRVAQVTNLVRALETLKGRGLWVVGVENVSIAQDYRSADLSMPLILVVGGEGQGMRRLVMETCDLLVRIPMRGRIGSLNASVAGSIVLYQAWMARRDSGSVEG